MAASAVENGMESENFLLQATCSQVHFFFLIPSSEVWFVTRPARGFQVAGRWRTEAGHLTPLKHLVCARHVRVGPFQAVKASPHSPSPGPGLVIALAVAPGGFFPGSLEAAKELSRYHEMSALGA